MRTANYTDFSNNPKSYINSVMENTDTVIINHSSGKGVVLMPIEEYNSITETLYIMSSPEMVRTIKEAREEIREGKSRIIDLDELWK